MKTYDITPKDNHVIINMNSDEINDVGEATVPMYKKVGDSSETNKGFFNKIRSIFNKNKE